MRTFQYKKSRLDFKLHTRVGFKCIWNPILYNCDVQYFSFYRNFWFHNLIINYCSMFGGGGSGGGRDGVGQCYVLPQPRISAISWHGVLHTVLFYVLSWDALLFYIRLAVYRTQAANTTYRNPIETDNAVYTHTCKLLSNQRPFETLLFAYWHGIWRAGRSDVRQYIILMNYAYCKYFHFEGKCNNSIML